MDSIPALTDEQRRIVEENIPLIGVVLRSYPTLPGHEIDDLRGHLFYALCRAVQRHDPTCGRLSTYVVNSLQGEAKHYFRDHSWSIKPPKRIRNQDNPVTHSMLSPLPIPETGVTGGQIVSAGGQDATVNPEQEVIDRVGGDQIISMIYDVLRPEERLILRVSLTGSPLGMIVQTFQVSERQAQRAWNELRAKVRDLYRRAEEGEDLPLSTGLAFLRTAMLQQFERLLDYSYGSARQCLEESDERRTICTS